MLNNIDSILSICASIISLISIILSINTRIIISKNNQKIVGNSNHTYQNSNITVDGKMKSYEEILKTKPWENVITHNLNTINPTINFYRDWESFLSSYDIINNNSIKFYSNFKEWVKITICIKE